MLYYIILNTNYILCKGNNRNYNNAMQCKKNGTITKKEKGFRSKYLF